MVKEGSPRGAREQLLQAVRAASGPLAGHWVLVRDLTPNYRREAEFSMSDCLLCAARCFNAHPYFPFSLVWKKNVAPFFPHRSPCI